jgi:hypothetical protein
VYALLSQYPLAYNFMYPRNMIYITFVDVIKAMLKALNLSFNIKYFQAYENVFLLPPPPPYLKLLKLSYPEKQ